MKKPNQNHRRYLHTAQHRATSAVTAVFLFCVNLVAKSLLDNLNRSFFKKKTFFQHVENYLVKELIQTSIGKENSEIRKK